MVRALAPLYFYAVYRHGQKTDQKKWPEKLSPAIFNGLYGDPEGT